MARAGPGNVAVTPEIRSELWGYKSKNLFLGQLFNECDDVSKGLQPRIILA